MSKNFYLIERKPSDYDEDLKEFQDFVEREIK